MSERIGRDPENKVKSGHSFTIIGRKAELKGNAAREMLVNGEKYFPLNTSRVFFSVK